MLGSHLAAVFFVACVMCLLLKRKIEIILPLMVCLSMPVLLVLAAFRSLNWVDFLAPTLILFSLIWLIIIASKRKPTVVLHELSKLFLTPGLACFVLLAVFWFFSCQKRSVLHFDEFSYWATQTRSFYVSNGLVNGMQTCCKAHASYVPGMQLIEWWFMHLRGEWHEGTLYSALFLINTVFFLPLTEHFSWKKPHQILFFTAGAILLPTAISSAPYHFLHVNSTLGALYGLILYTIQKESEHRHFMLAVQMTALVLIKQTGILWVLFALLFILCVQRIPWTRKMTLTLLCPLIAILLWGLCCHILGLRTENIDALRNGASFKWEHVFSAWKGMAKLLLTKPMNMTGAWNDALPLLGVPSVVLVIIYCLIHAWSESFSKRCIRGVWWIAGTFALIVLVMAVSMFTVFASEVERWAKSRSNTHLGLDLYMMPYFYGTSYLCIAQLRDHCHRIHLSFPKKGILAGTAFAVLLCVNWQMVSWLLPSEYLKAFPVNNGSKWMRNNLEWYQQLKEKEDCRVMTSTEVSSSYRYALVPLSFEYVPDEVAASYEQLEEYIDQTGCSYVVIIGDRENTRILLQESFQHPIELGRPYRIDKSKKTYCLTEMDEAVRTANGDAV
ncbi:MAG: hypothetical protein J6K55_06680 [Clostridia bacterium]|nr:hypothetical protein [Clostridia bacterium]